MKGESAGDIGAVTTLAQRKRAEAARRARAAADLLSELRAYAEKHGGRFVVFGSAATGTVRYDSDLDVLVDFPETRVGEAWCFVEDACARHGIDPDLHDAATSTAAFVERVRAKGIVLP